MNTQTPAYILMGRPGSGKGTQAHHIQEQFRDAYIVSSGALFREIAKADSVIGRRIKEDTEKGFLAPNWLASYFFEKSIIEAPEDTMLIFDGFGRKLEEAEVIDTVFSWLRRPYYVINLAVSEEMSEKRITGRKDIEHRADDSHLHKRLEEYDMYTKPALAFFTEKGVVIDVDGEADVAVVEDEIISILEKYDTN